MLDYNSAVLYNKDAQPVLTIAYEGRHDIHVLKTLIWLNHVTKNWAHKTDLAPPLVIEESVPCQTIERAYICVLSINFPSVSTIYLLDFLSVSDTVVYFVFHWITLLPIRHHTCGDK
jgi:hypothetical protein